MQCAASPLHKLRAPRMYVKKIENFRPTRTPDYSYIGFWRRHSINNKEQSGAWSCSKKFFCIECSPRRCHWLAGHSFLCIWLIPAQFDVSINRLSPFTNPSTYFRPGVVHVVDSPDSPDSPLAETKIRNFFSAVRGYDFYIYFKNEPRIAALTRAEGGEKKGKL